MSARPQGSPPAPRGGHPAKKGILLAAFGSSSPLGEKALRSFAEKVRLRFPGLPVRWAFTSGMMRSRLAAAGKKTDSVKKALCRMGFERYSQVAVQSLHLIPGAEYEALLEEIDSAAAEGGPRKVSVGLPLLHDEGDVARATTALLAHLPPERRPGEAVVCMGHGTWHSGAASYQALASRVAAQDPCIHIGTLEGEHALENLLPSLRTGESGKVWLLPLLSVIGKHAEKDMAGGHAHSWRGQIEAAGFVCRPVLTGTVEYAGFAEIWIDHLKTALNALDTADSLDAVAELNGEGEFAGRSEDRSGRADGLVRQDGPGRQDRPDGPDRRDGRDGPGERSEA